MNLRGLAFLALRLLAVYVVITGIRHAANLVDVTIPTYMQMAELNVTLALLVVGIPTVLLWVVGILLWCSAEKWSGYLIPASVQAEKPALRNAEIESFALSVVGLIIAILSFFRLLQSVLSYISLLDQNVHVDSQSYFYNFAALAAELATGIILLLKSQGIAALLRKIRGAGLENGRA